MPARRRTAGSVRRLPSGRWQARIRDPRTNRLESLGSFPTKADADRAVAVATTDGLRDLDVVEKIVEVRGELHTGGPKTRAGRRQVPLPRPAADELAVHLERFVATEPDALVFAGPDGGALRARHWRARHWVPANAEAGRAPLRPHDLRHTAVALWIAQGASPKQIATWAGHTSVSVVFDRYGHLFPGHEDAVMQRLAGYTQPVARCGADIVALEP